VVAAAPGCANDRIGGDRPTIGIRRLVVQPFRFLENRVWRCYRGGQSIDRLRGRTPGEDGAFPEDWIASVVEARNPQQDTSGEGISTALVDNREVRFDQLVADHAADLFGPAHVARYGRTPAFLAKLLDSAIRLPLQVHPDRGTARRLYGSDFGKTEVWIVLGTRSINGEDPYLLLGFNDTLRIEEFIADGLAGQSERPLTMVHRHSVKPGDVLLLTGGLVHAIGPGVFLVEIMEPSDWVVQPELMCGEQPLTQGDRFGPVDPAKAMRVFDFVSMSRQEAWDSAALTPSILVVQGASSLHQLVGPEQTPYFGAQRLDLNGTWEGNARIDAARAGIMVAGAAVLETNYGRLSLQAGDTFFVPFTADTYRYQGTATIIFALPPAPGKNG